MNNGTTLIDGSVANFVGAGTKALLLVCDELDSTARHVWSNNQDLLQRRIAHALAAPDDRVYYPVDQQVLVPEGKVLGRPELSYMTQYDRRYVTVDGQFVSYQFRRLPFRLTPPQDNDSECTGLVVYHYLRDRFSLHQCLSLQDGEEIIKIGTANFLDAMGSFKKNGQVGVLPLWKSVVKETQYHDRLSVPCVGVSSTTACLEIWWRYLDTGYFGNAPTVLLR